MNRYIKYSDGELFVESVAVSNIADSFGSPTYVYSKALIEEAFESYKTALEPLRHLICYAVKANSNLAVLDVLARLGAGFDIVSEGELSRIIAAGGNPRKVVFSGVGKTASAMAMALQFDIYCFNLESRSELESLNRLAKAAGKKAPVSIRINPDIDAATHPYIATGMRENKFGVPISEAIPLYDYALKLSNISIEGIDCHIGSQLTDINPIVNSIRQLRKIVNLLRAKNIKLKHVNLGGGLGVVYRNEEPPSISEYANAILNELKDEDIKLVVEPGRSIVANAGLLITKVQYLKTTPHRNFAIVDAAMNDLLRPALYDAWQEIVPALKGCETKGQIWDIVGPVCESGDFLGHQRNLYIEENDILAVLGAGAYGFSMSSNYNSRCRAAEIMIDGDRVHLARKRESLEDLILGESCMPMNGREN